LEQDRTREWHDEQAGMSSHTNYFFGVIGVERATCASMARSACQAHMLGAVPTQIASRSKAAAICNQVGSTGDRAG